MASIYPANNKTLSNKTYTVKSIMLNTTTINTGIRSAENLNIKTVGVGRPLIPYSVTNELRTRRGG